MSIPYTFPGVRSTASVIEEFNDKVEPGDHTEVKVRVAGRLMLRRGQGKVAFGQLADSSGRIQLFAPADITENFDGFADLTLGTWIGVDGVVVKTRRGELSVQVEQWTLLAETRRQFPDKFHGLADVDLRYRQRYVDLWVTEESRNAFIVRSKIVSLIRRWLEDEGFMEVETPILHPVLGGATALPFSTHYNALDRDMFLRIAPELYLKRLVGGGFERVFELGRDFRNEGISPRHNPEFTMLEWYEAYADASGAMTRTENMISYIAQEILGTTNFDYDGREIDLSTPWRRATLAELTSEQVGEKLSLEDEPTLKRVAQDVLDYVDPNWGPGKLLLEIYEKTTEHTLWGPIFVTEYPKEVSPLARDHATVPGMTDRFECIVAGRELENGFSELIDPDEQRARFEDQVKKKAEGDKETMEVDEDYLRAMEYGFPPMSGIGIGIDRLAMLLTGTTNIRDVVLFPTLRPENNQ